MNTVRGRRPCSGRLATLGLAGVLTIAWAGSPAVADAVVDPVSPAEQWLVYELNRARWSPTAYAAEFGVTPGAPVSPQPPLAVNNSLFSATGFKAQQTFEYPSNFQSSPSLPYYHCSNATGTWVCPNGLAVSHGFPLPSNWPLDQNFIEVYWGSTGSGTPQELIAAFMASPGHVGVMFQWPNYEIGAGQYDACAIDSTRGCNFIFMHLTPRSPIKLFVTGVVFSDGNGNGRLDIGEGIPGVTVSAGTAGTVITNGGGGYSIPVTAGTYTLTASGAGFATATATATVTEYNVGVDFIGGSAQGVIRAYELCEGLQPTLLGTGGNDVLTGTSGDDVIHGLDGDDVINGGGGNDTICGGEGNDTINGIAELGDASPGPGSTPPCPAGEVCDTVVLVDAGGRWYRHQSLEAGATVDVFYYGQPGDFPFSGDWNCDGTKTPGLYRQSDGYAYLRNTNTQGVADIAYFFGVPGDIPIAGDFDADGCDTLSIYRPSEGRVYISDTLGANGGYFTADYSYYFGVPGDKPFVGDFNGDGIDTIGLYRQTTGFVYFRNTNTQGAADNSFYYGLPGDRILTGDWDHNGTDTVAVYRPTTGRIYFNLQNIQSAADYTLHVGTYTGAARS